MPATVERIEASIAAFSACLAPAEVKAFAATIDKLFRFGRTFGLGNPDTATATAFYREALADLPPDLLAKAIDAVCHGWKWGHKLPLPADIRAAVADELSERKLVLRRLEMAKARRQREMRPVRMSAPVKRDTTAIVKTAYQKPEPEPTEADLERARQRMLDQMQADPDFAQHMRP